MTRPYKAPSDQYHNYVCSICTELEIHYYYYYYWQEESLLSKSLTLFLLINKNKLGFSCASLWSANLSLHQFKHLNYFTLNNLLEKLVFLCFLLCLYYFTRVTQITSLEKVNGSELIGKEVFSIELSELISNDVISLDMILKEVISSEVNTNEGNCN